MPTRFFFRNQLTYETLLAQGLAPRPDPARTFLALCNAIRPDATFRWDDTADLASVIATELPEGNGYARIPVRSGDYKPINIDATNNLITVPAGHSFSNGDPVILISASGSLNFVNPYQL